MSLQHNCVPASGMHAQAPPPVARCARTTVAERPTALLSPGDCCLRRSSGAPPIARRTTRRQLRVACASPDETPRRRNVKKRAQVSEAKLLPELPAVLQSKDELLHAKDELLQAVKDVAAAQKLALRAELRRAADEAMRTAEEVQSPYAAVTLKVLEQK